MAQLDPETLQRLARKYIWWKTPNEASTMPERLVAQVMNIDDYSDVQAVANQAGDDFLRDVLIHAEIGQFSERSWAYWHYRLGLALPGKVSRMPERRFLQDELNAFTVLVPDGGTTDQPVNVSFFGTIGFGRVGLPETTDDGILQVAALDDLMATKVKVILQRIEAKDYRDIAAMVKAGVSLSNGLAAACAMYGHAFQPSESLKAMTYFKGGDLNTLTDEEMEILITAASAVRELPRVEIQSWVLALE